VRVCPAQQASPQMEQQSRHTPSSAVRVMERRGLGGYVESLLVLVALSSGLLTISWAPAVPDGGICQDITAYIFGQWPCLNFGCHFQQLTATNALQLHSSYP
jgi:hypothetical protein